ncbi:MAG TPA: phospho-N-acetylmuramoyl-pentapeptide-transferase [Candidatus Acidoferrum sp.]|jgi:phospho-N-acetylmuramoyl-pentapeptide-transferase|nr:phospho-N-acetylmuramoyl-pentapeptide-transferase [Candidatus Acidoferrum sp.]
MTPLIVFVTALIVSALVFPAAIGRLARARMGQQIREEGPAAHHAKAGTPTAGGIVFVVVALVLYLVADRSLAGAFVLIALGLGGALGFIDDFSAVRGGRNLGLRARYKIVIQLLTGALLGLLALQWGLTSQLVPFDGRRALGAWMILVTALAVAAGSNAFNLTDGSDGLAAGAGAVSFGALALVAVLQHHPSVGLMPAILAGCLVGFLFYNLFPARIFMGDTGSLALGTAMVAAAIVTGFLWFLPLLALVFVVETVTVIVQVASFKMTGNRPFRMSPLHNHFIVAGWKETPLALWFWAGSLVAAALAVALARPGPAA